MMRFGWLFVVFTLATAVPAGAQSPAAHATPTSAAMSKKIPVSNLSNPSVHSNNAGTMSGQGCMSGPTANRAQTTVNPINGHAQAATIVAIPIGKGSGSMQSATTHAQQAQACAHTH